MKIRLEYFRTLGAFVFLAIPSSIAAEAENNLFAKHGAEAANYCVNNRGATIEITLCLESVHREVQQALDEQIAALLVTAKSWDEIMLPEPDITPALQESTKAWDGLVEEHCKLVENIWSGGSGQYNAVLSCMIELRAAQIKQLQLLALN